MADDGTGAPRAVEDTEAEVSFADPSAEMAAVVGAAQDGQDGQDIGGLAP